MILHNINVDISLGAAVWTENFPEYENRIRDCLARVIPDVAEARNFSRFPRPELSILLTDDENIQALNRQYRDRDRPTNVLSFPALSDDEIEDLLRQGKSAPEYPVALGDVIFAFETAAAEARCQGKSLADHFCHLLLHGMLHLLGYDHKEKDEAAIMEGLEKRLLAKLSIDDPYQD